jgi:hypothetical protein
MFSPEVEAGRYGRDLAARRSCGRRNYAHGSLWRNAMGRVCSPTFVTAVVLIAIVASLGYIVHVSQSAAQGQDSSLLAPQGHAGQVDVALRDTERAFSGGSRGPAIR